MMSRVGAVFEKLKKMLGRRRDAGPLLLESLGGEWSAQARPRTPGAREERPRLPRRGGLEPADRIEARPHPA